MNTGVPLAETLRPKDFKDFVGQAHLVGRDGILTKLMARDMLPSLILWGPPGSGKTTLAHLVATKIQAHFVALSAVTAKLDDVRKIVAESAVRQSHYHQRTILFIDEIHRFNKAQQDAFLPHVSIRKKIDKQALAFLLEAANGDCRILLTTLEIAAGINPKPTLKLPDIEQAFQKKQLLYDTAGEEHYNTISAFIKSMRASQPDAALYYLARMVEAGEDSLFIARRMVIFASEDVGMAQPTALVVANEVFKSCEVIGYPECAINLAHGVVYLALAKKDRSAYDGLRLAQEDVRRFGNLPIPLFIRNAPTKLMKELGYGKGYEKYSQASFLPDKLRERKYYIMKKDKSGL